MALAGVYSNQPIDAREMDLVDSQEHGSEGTSHPLKRTLKVIMVILRALCKIYNRPSFMLIPGSAQSNATGMQMPRNVWILLGPGVLASAAAASVGGRRSHHKI